MCVQRPEKGEKSSRDGVTVAVSHSVWMEESSLGPLKGQRVLITTEPSLKVTIITPILQTKNQGTKKLHNSEKPRVSQIINA